MKLDKKYFIILLLFIVLTLLVFSLFPTGNNTIDNSNFYTVTHVTDGDTIVVKDSNNIEHTIRYIGVDTPESVKPNTPVQCFAKKASDYNKSLVMDKKVLLESDKELKDKYGRELMYVYIDQNNDGKYEEMVNKILVTEGYARVLTIAPDTKYVNIFKSGESYAKQNNLGLWNECNNPNITETVLPSVSTSQTEDCTIKGNISSNGDKIYHMPGQKYYDSTIIEQNKGEKLYCTEDQAIADGFRKSKV